MRFYRPCVAGSRIELETSGLWIRRSDQLSYPAIYFAFANAKLYLIYQSNKKTSSFLPHFSQSVLQNTSNTHIINYLPIRFFLCKFKGSYNRQCTTNDANNPPDKKSLQIPPIFVVLSELFHKAIPCTMITWYWQDARSKRMIKTTNHLYLRYHQLKAGVEGTNTDSKIFNFQPQVWI